MTERPVYRVLIEGQKHFDCKVLRATLSTRSCSSQWEAAQIGSSCHECALGRKHTKETNPNSPRLRRLPKSLVCPRCGETGRRIIGTRGVCVSCANRQYEWINGRNAKGRVPATYVPPRDIEVAIELDDGSIEIRLVQARHAAEALSHVLRGGLVDGAELVDSPRPGPTNWNAATQSFEFVCKACGESGLIVERVRRGVLERFHWCCEGRDPPGAGWTMARVRQPVSGMHPATLADWMDRDPSLAVEATVDETIGKWISTPHFCGECRAGQILGMLTAPGGRWKTGCSSCGATSEETADAA